MLVYLTEAARFNSITAAADYLMVTPSTITHSLNMLKKELGGDVSLYERTNNGIVFTEKGKALVNIANSILKDLNSMKIIANKSISNGESIFMTIGKRIILCANLGISTALSELPLILYEHYPYTDFSMVDLPYQKILSNINKDDEVFGVAYIMDDHLKDFEKYNNIDFKILYTSSLGIQISNNSKFIPIEAKSVSWKQLAKLPIVFVTYNSSLQNQILQSLLKYNETPNILLNSATTQAAVRIISKDLAVLFSSSSLQSDYLKQYNLRFVPVREHTYVHIVFLYNKKAKHQTIQVLSSFLSRYLNNVYV